MRLRMALESVRGSIYRRGVARTFMLALDRIFGRAAARVDSDDSFRFDSDHGVDTAGFRPGDEIGIDETNRASAVRYEATPPTLLGTTVESLALIHECFTFIDLGAGKGRPLLEASHFPFKKLVGVERSTHLASVARANLARYAAPERRCWESEVIEMDAAEYALPVGNLVIFLFNPFGEPVMTRMLARIDAQRAADPALELYVIYVNPVLMKMFDRAPFLERLSYRSDPTHDVAVYRGRTRRD